MQPESNLQIELPQMQEAMHPQPTVDLDEMANFKQLVNAGQGNSEEILEPLEIVDTREKDNISGYEVQPGDTFSSIARESYEDIYGYKPSPAVHKQLTTFIAKHNGLNDLTSDLEPGQVLRIPSREAIEDHFNVCFPNAEENEELLAYIQSINEF